MTSIKEEKAFYKHIIKTMLKRTQYPEGFKVHPDLPYNLAIQSKAVCLIEHWTKYVDEQMK